MIKQTLELPKNKSLQPNWHIIDDKWVHIVTVEEGEYYKTYRDGKLIGEKISI